jgi:phosphoglucomutase
MLFTVYSVYYSQASYDNDLVYQEIRSSFMNHRYKELEKPSHERMLSSIDSYILSSSGWRAVFAPSKDPEDGSPDILSEDLFIAAAIASNILSYLAEIEGKAEKDLSLLIASDTRPTGPAIADAIITMLVSKGCDTSFLGVAPAPEIMAYSELSGLFDGFIYISASHNPKGYNGIKFGRGGAVFDSNHALRLKDRFIADINRPEIIDEIFTSLTQTDSLLIETVYNEQPEYKDRSLDAYRVFTGSVAAGSSYICGQDQIYNTIRSYAQQFGLGILADYNGSARILSVDEMLFDAMGVAFKKINDVPGQFAHRIVPEGKSLEPCSRALEQAYSEDPAFIIGFVPDCDGDRGNIVYIDESEGRAKILEAQQVFALCVLSELCYISVKSETPQKLAVVVNGPTSMRIDEIASVFGAEVHRSEVGEANAVELAKNLREDGYTVRILGEGSNGGNITHPAQVRDPLNTLISLLKLLSFRSQSDNGGLFERWCSLTGRPYDEYFSLSDVIASLPVYTTTSAYEPRAVMQVNTTDQHVLKTRYEQEFVRFWDENRKMFTQLGIHSWKQFNTIGTQEIEGTGPETRASGETGGHKVAFYDESGRMTDYIWMRGSKTEPVLRILADCMGADPEREELLLSMHRKLIEAADNS